MKNPGQFCVQINTLVTLPARVAQTFAYGFGLVTAKPPVDIRNFPVSVFWRRRNDADPRIGWINSRLWVFVPGQEARTS
jgi:hypothetical protein